MIEQSTEHRHPSEYIAQKQSLEGNHKQRWVTLEGHSCTKPGGEHLHLM